MSGYTDPFGGSPVQPGDVSFRAISTSSSIYLEWPALAITGQPIARVMDVVALNSGVFLALPDARDVSPGQDFLLTNRGGFSVSVLDNAGANLATLTSGQSRYVYLTDNSTSAGVWTSMLFGAASATIDASQLAGRGLQARGLLLDSAIDTTFVSVSRSLADTDRATLVVWTGAGGTLTLPSNASLARFYCEVRNAGTGPLVLAAFGGQLIDGVASINLVPGEATFVHIAQGVAAYTVGRKPQLVLTRATFTITGGTRVLTLVESANVVQNYAGTLTSNQIIDFPATVQTYFVSNNTAGAFTLTFRAAGAGATVTVPTGQNAILVCTGTDVINASTTTAGIAALVLGSGSAANPSLAVGAANNGIYAPTVTSVGVSAGGVLSLSVAQNFTEAVGSGAVQLSSRSTASSSEVSVVGAAGFFKRLALRTAGLLRWALESNNVAESGSNAGSNLVIRSYNDAGAALTDVVTITRSTGAVAIPGTATLGALAVTTNATVGGSLTVTGGSTLASLAVTSAASVGGSLTVTGGSTLASLSVTSAASVGGSLTVTGGSTLASLSVTSAASVGGTLTVTGAATLASLGGNLNAAGYKLTSLAAGANAGDSARFEQLFSQGTPQDIAATATTNIGAPNTTFLRLTGTGASISSFGVAYNGPRVITVQTAGNTLIDSSSLETYTGDDMPLGAGDSLVVVPKATTSGTPDGWRVAGYLPFGAPVDAVSKTELQNQTVTAFTTTGTGTVYTITPTPAVAAYAANQSFYVHFHTACSDNPTLQVSALASPPSLVKLTSAGTYTSLVAGDIVAGQRSQVTLLSTTQAVVHDVVPRAVVNISALVKKSNTSGFSLTSSGMSVVFPTYSAPTFTELSDPAGVFNAATGVFTIRRSGTYRFVARGQSYFVSDTYNTQGMACWVNLGIGLTFSGSRSDVVLMGPLLGMGSSYPATTTGEVVVELVAGDTATYSNFSALFTSTMTGTTNINPIGGSYPEIFHTLALAMMELG